ncbi:hypothetical protein OUZ56_027729 [Daphnia magna]|uniref:Uncharacterized protein n=1 Tax=Daphnia magna TaxID=35525 RepID=A0ABR0B2E0_9CRUS|nr:hypothetical protein OUZ56_027729 [Daphnia magna]
MGKKEGSEEGEKKQHGHCGNFSCENLNFAPVLTEGMEFYSQQRVRVFNESTVRVLCRNN